MDICEFGLIDIFDRLDKWRNYPTYQLERRADIFFSFCIPELVEKLFYKKERKAKVKALIPEFPSRTEQSEKKGQYRFHRIDYVAFVEMNNHNKYEIVFIELKTDLKSIKPSQLDYLEKAKNKGISSLFKDIKEAFSLPSIKKSTRGKYAYLLNKMLNNKLIIINSICRIKYNSSGISVKNWRMILDKSLYDVDIENNWKRADLKTILISPNEQNNINESVDKVITFEDLRSILPRNGNTLWGRFSESLKKWEEVKAGQNEFYTD